MFLLFLLAGSGFTLGGASLLTKGEATKVASQGQTLSTVVVPVQSDHGDRIAALEKKTRRLEKLDGEVMDFVIQVLADGKVAIVRRPDGSPPPRRVETYWSQGLPGKKSDPILIVDSQWPTLRNRGDRDNWEVALALTVRREREDAAILIRALNRSKTSADACLLLKAEHGWQTSPRSLRDLFETLRTRFPDLDLKTPGHHLNQTGQVPVNKPQAVPSSAVRPGVLVSAVTADRAFIDRPKVQPDNSGREQTILVCPDTHVPYHDPAAWEVFLNVARKLRPDVLVMIGDFADCYAISSHLKSPTRRHRFIEELDVVNEKLDELCALRVPRMVWTAGNHEARSTKIVAERVPELDGLVRTLPEYLRVAERGIEWVPYRQGINIGRMFFTHDVGRCGVYAARQSLIDVGGNVTFGHSHRAAVAYQGTAKGEGHVSLNVGWLGSYDEIDYVHAIRARRDWQHAFGLVDMDETGCVWGQVIPIVNEVAMVRGQRVAA